MIISKNLRGHQLYKIQILDKLIIKMNFKDHKVCMLNKRLIQKRGIHIRLKKEKVNQKVKKFYHGIVHIKRK